MKFILLVVILTLFSCIRIGSKNRFMNRKKIMNSRYRNNQKYQLQVTQDSQDELTIRLVSMNYTFFEMPHRYPFAFTKKQAQSKTNNYKVLLNDGNNQMLGFKVVRRDSNHPLIDTSACSIVYNKNAIQFCNRFSNDYVFGLGQRRSEFKYSFPNQYSQYPRKIDNINHDQFQELDDRKYITTIDGVQILTDHDEEFLGLSQEKTYSLFQRDAQDDLDKGQAGQQTHGFHPVYISREPDNKFNIVLVRNTYPMQFRLRKVRNEELNRDDYIIDFILTGGPLELKIFLGQNPNDVIRKYHSYLNGYQVPQFWTFGYHQSRYGFESSRQVNHKLGFYRSNRIPIDVIWIDIDHMKDYKSFTFDNERFSQESIAKMCETYRVRWVPIQDEFIEISQKYQPFVDGINKDMFYRERSSGQIFRGCGYIGQTVFPSYMKTKSIEYVNDIINQYMNDQLGKNQKYLGGIWLDLNEPANFKELNMEDGNYNLHCWLQAPFNFNQDNIIESMNKLVDRDLDLVKRQVRKLDSEQIPLINNMVHRLEYKTIRLDSYTNYNKDLLDEINEPELKEQIEQRQYLSHFETHTVQCLLQTFFFNMALKPYYEKNQDNVFILTRSNVFGQGRFSQHWLGDTGSTYEHLRLSTSQIFAAQLFGMPLTGDDVCGFMRVTEPILCARWFMLGSLYPFFRNHNIKESPDQDPSAFSDQKNIFRSIQSSIQKRYTFVKWYYSVVVRQKGLGGVFKPLWFDYYQHDISYSDENIILLGNEIVAYNNYQNLEHVTISLPDTLSIYDLNTGVSYNGVFEFSNPIENGMPMFLVQGYTVNFQNYKEDIQNTHDLDNQFDFIAGLVKVNDTKYVAKGQMMSIKDYFNDVYHRCIKGSDCIIDYIIHVEIDSKYVHAIYLIVHLLFRKLHHPKNIYDC